MADYVQLQEIDIATGRIPDPLNLLPCTQDIEDIEDVPTQAPLLQASHVDTVYLFMPGILSTVPFVGQVLGSNSSTTTYFVGCNAQYDGLCPVGNGMTYTDAPNTAQFIVTTNCQATQVYNCTFPSLSSAACVLTGPASVVATEVTVLSQLTGRNNNVTESTSEKTTEKSADQTPLATESITQTVQSTSHASEITILPSKTNTPSQPENAHTNASEVTMLTAVTMYYSGASNISYTKGLTQPFSRIQVAIVTPELYRVGQMAAPPCQPANFTPSIAARSQSSMIALLSGIALITVFFSI